jgi:lysophospholipase L1-like esterase
MNKQIIIILLISAMTSCSDQATLQPLDNNATVLAFGDSLTYGTGSSLDKAYPAVLEGLIRRKVINAGVPGEISQKGLSRLPQLISQYRPDLIIICHGGNDILHKLDVNQTKQNIQHMIDLARQSNTQVLLIGVPEFGLFFNSSPIYQSLAEENHIPIENEILGEILGNNSLKSDHIHPNTQGYQLFAEQIDSLLRQSGAI